MVPSTRTFSTLACSLVALFVCAPTPVAHAADQLPVLDFCEMLPKSDSNAFQRKRLVLFGMGNLKLVEAGEATYNKKGEKKKKKKKILKKIGAAKHVKNVWTMTFPLRRFSNILIEKAAPKRWFKKPTLSVAGIQKHLRKHDNGQFYAYSVACADFIALPRFTQYDAGWRFSEKKKKVKKKVVTVKAWSLDVASTVELAIYRRNGDKFERVEVVEESGGGLFDAVTDLGASTMKMAKEGNKQLAGKLRGGMDKAKGPVDEMQANIKKLESDEDEKETEVTDLKAKLRKARKRKTKKLLKGKLKAAKTALADVTQQIGEAEAMLEEAIAFIEDSMSGADMLARAQNLGWPALVSGVPGPDCAIGRPLDGRPGIPRCATGKSWLPKRSVGVAGMSERAGKYCKKVGDNDLPAIARCESRVRAENLTLTVQKEAKKVEGWLLFSPLQVNAETDPGITVGQDEGVRSGDMFVAVRRLPDGSSERLGFARVVAAGPGGAGGTMEPSKLAWRAGDAPPGTRMEEHPQIGVGFGVLAGASTLLDTSDGVLARDMSLLSGASLEVGYSLTPYVPLSWGEIWLRTQLDTLYTFGDYTNGMLLSPGSHHIDWIFLNFYAGPEIKIYVMSRVDLFAGLRGGTSIVLASDMENELKNADGDKISDSAFGLGYGAVASTGLDFLITPDWIARVAVQYRANFSDIIVEGPDNAEIAEGVSVFSTLPEAHRNLGTLSGVNGFVGLNYIF